LLDTITFPESLACMRLPTLAPASSTARHNEIDGQASRDRLKSPTCTCVQAFGPPVGSFEVMTFPAASTATHTDSDGHDTPEIAFEPSTLTRLHVDATAAGFVDVRTFPASSTATHNDRDGHERPVRLLASILPSERHGTDDDADATAARTRHMTTASARTPASLIFLIPTLHGTSSETWPAPKSFDERPATGRPTVRRFPSNCAASFELEPDAGASASHSRDTVATLSP